MVFLKICQIQKKTPLLESLFNTVTGLKRRSILHVWLVVFPCVEGAKIKEFRRVFGEDMCKNVYFQFLTSKCFFP